MSYQRPRGRCDWRWSRECWRSLAVAPRCSMPIVCPCHQTWMSKTTFTHRDVFNWRLMKQTNCPPYFKSYGNGSIQVIHQCPTIKDALEQAHQHRRLSGTGVGHSWVWEGTSTNRCLSKERRDKLGSHEQKSSRDCYAAAWH